MTDQPALKRMNVYLNPDDLNRVAEQLGCRPSEAVRRLIDNYLLATEIDAARQMPGATPEHTFRRGDYYRLPGPANDTTPEEDFAEPSE